MKRIIAVGLIALLAFTAVGLARPDEADAYYNDIIRYFNGEITEAELRAILNAEGVDVVSIEPDAVTTNSPPGTGPPPDPNRPADLTPWDMIRQYAASQNAANPAYCAATVSVTLPSNISTYGGQTFTVANLHYDAAYCSALLYWEASYDFYPDDDKPPPPTPPGQ